jgi:hypothetical protein
MFAVTENPSLMDSHIILAQNIRVPLRKFTLRLKELTTFHSITQYWTNGLECPNYVRDFFFHHNLYKLVLI